MPEKKGKTPLSPPFSQPTQQQQQQQYRMHTIPTNSNAVIYASTGETTYTTPSLTSQYHYPYPSQAQQQQQQQQQQQEIHLLEPSASSSMFSSSSIGNATTRFERSPHLTQQQQLQRSDETNFTGDFYADETETATSPYSYHPQQQALFMNTAEIISGGVV